MKYIEIIKNNICTNYEEILKKVSETDEDIMLTGDTPTRYQCGEVNLIDLINLLSFKRDRIFVSFLDINSDFDYFKFFSLASIQLPVLINCVSFCKKRLKQENLKLEKKLFEAFKEKCVGADKIIVGIYGGYEDILKGEFSENINFFKKHDLQHVCLLPYPYNFSVINYYLFQKNISRNAVGILDCPPINIPTENNNNIKEI